jgi:hypothetical protein
MKMLNIKNNPNGKPNSDVVRSYFNAKDVLQIWQKNWIIDFGASMTIEEASGYEAPFEYVKLNVKPIRDNVRTPREKKYWWLHRRPAPDMRVAIQDLKRFIVTPAVSKHRIFAWLSGSSIPDHQLHVIARDDDYFLGILHSKFHELWARATGTQLREVESGFRYTPTSTFETFPFPFPPGQEPKDDRRVQSISQAAKDLVEQRDRWLNAEKTSEVSQQDSKDLKPSNETSEVSAPKRTLTNLYNAYPTWLELAHKRLDQAVFAAYGWQSDLSDEEILEKLLALNLERST